MFHKSRFCYLITKTETLKLKQKLQPSLKNCKVRKIKKKNN